MGWVKHARVMRLLPDSPGDRGRRSARCWRSGSTQARLDVIATDGRVTTEADPGHFPSLPLVVGEGANTEAASLLAMLANSQASWSA